MNAHTVPQVLVVLVVGLLLLAGGSMVNAQTATTTTPAPTPGVPNTGAGASTMLVLGSAAALSLSGAIYLLATKRRTLSAK